MGKIDIDKLLLSLRNRLGYIKGFAVNFDLCLRDQGLKYIDTPDGGRLEKQGEQKFRIGDTITNGKLVGTVDEINELGYHAFFGDHYADVPCKGIENWELVEQKPSAEDAFVLETHKKENLIKIPKFKVGDFIQYNGMGHNRYTIKEVCGISHYINSDGHRMDMSYTDANFELVEQKPIEWSEEDEEMIDSIIGNIQYLYSLGSCDNATVEMKVNWLKSLRPQKQWKPTEEQMKSLAWVVENGNTCQTAKLKEILEQLKAL